MGSRPLGAQEALPPLREADTTVCSWAAWPCSRTGTSRFSVGTPQTSGPGARLVAPRVRRAKRGIRRAPSRHAEPVLGTQSTILARRPRPGHAEPFLGTQSTVPACRTRPGHAEHRPGPCQALCLSAEGRRLHGSDRGHSSRRQCPEARGVHTARETPRGAALVLGWGRGVQKAMRRLWGCRRGPPSVGLLGGQALTLSGVCSLPHAALSLREMHPLPTGAQAETRDAPPRDPLRQQLASTPIAPGRLVLSAAAGGSHSGFLPAPRQIPPKGAHPHDPSALLPKTTAWGLGSNALILGEAKTSSVAMAHSDGQRIHF